MVFFVLFSGQDVFLDYCQKLLEKFRYPWELMPLMYVILKDADANIEEASRRIEEGKFANGALSLYITSRLVIGRLINGECLSI